MDLIGPLEVESCGGVQCVLQIIDDFSRFSFVYYLKKNQKHLNLKNLKISRKSNCRKIRAIKSEIWFGYQNLKLQVFWKN